VEQEFDLATENQVLKERIIARIRDEGAITFRDFMAMALYESGLGYYCTERETIGRGGDYLTSPEVSSVFGVMVGRQLREMWEAMGSPARWDLVEAGAGNGTLCRDVLRWAHGRAPEFFETIEYKVVEPISSLQARQRKLLDEESLEANASWLAELPDSAAGCVLSNELLDSMPVHRVQVDDGKVREVFVNWDGTQFREELRAPSTQQIEGYFERVGIMPGDGCTAEVNLAAPDWMARAGAALRNGFVLTFDYGYEAEELYAPWRKQGTLLSFYKHNPSNDPYPRIGRQDMTSHVDFTSLREAGEAAGLTTLGLVSQSEFLTNLGIGEALPTMSDELSLEERLARRRAISELVDPAGLGRIKVLVQAKGVEKPSLRGFGGGTD
jgi:SAM-dependent MidA family methyltransferase